MLETEILEYFPDTTKSIVVQEYFELNKNAGLNLKSHGTDITFLAENEIKKSRIEEYLIIDDVRLGVETGMVDFQLCRSSEDILSFLKSRGDGLIEAMKHGGRYNMCPKTSTKVWAEIRFDGNFKLGI